MIFTEQSNTPGEHPFSCLGPAGLIEGVMTVPDQVNRAYFAILGHPHSLQGGTMNNKVVTTLARVYKELHIASIRFNFRGVGQSAGTFDEGIGESEDMLFLASQILKEHPGTKLLFSGFSFGSYVAYRAASQSNSALLLTIAPPVHHYNYREFTPHPSPWVIIQGVDDDVVPYELVQNFSNQESPPLPLLMFAETGHFFHGKLIELKSRLLDTIQSYMEVI